MFALKYYFLCKQILGCINLVILKDHVMIYCIDNNQNTSQNNFDTTPFFFFLMKEHMQQQFFNKQTWVIQ